MSWQDERGLATISSTCGLQNFTWSFLTSSSSRYFRTYDRKRRQSQKLHAWYLRRPFCSVPDGKSEPGWCSPSCWWEICSGGRAEAAAAGRCCRRSTRDWSRTSSLNSWECPAGRCARRRAGRSACEAEFLLNETERFVSSYIYTSSSSSIFLPFTGCTEFLIPEIWSRGPLQSQTGQVDCGIGQQVEHSH